MTARKLAYAEIRMWFAGSDRQGPPDEVSGVMQDDKYATAGFAAAVLLAHADGECGCQKGGA